MMPDQSSGHHPDAAWRSAGIRRYDALEQIRKAVEAAGGDLDRVLAAIAAAADQVLPAGATTVVEMRDGDACVVRSSSNPSRARPGTRVALAKSLAGASLDAGVPLVCDDTDLDDRLDRDRARRHGVRAMIVVPIPRHGSFVGVLKLLAPRPSAFDASDVVVAQVLVGHIATALAQANERHAIRDMRQSQERLQLALLASESIGIWDWDVASDLCFADAGFARLFGLDPVQAAEGLRGIGDLLAAVHADDRMWVEAAVRRAMAEGGDLAIEHRVQLPGGLVRWMSVRGRSYGDPEGRPVRFPGAAVDITERKRVETSLRDAEANARLAVKAAGLGLWHYDFAGDALTWDEPCRAIFGLPPEAVPTLDAVMGSVHPRSRAVLQDTVRNATEHGRLIDQLHEFEIVRPDGETRWAQVAAQLVFEDGRCTRVIGTAGDITVRKRLESTLREDEQRFRTMAESIPQLAWMATPAAEIVWFNERWFDYTGTTADDMRGQGWGRVHPAETFPAVSARMRLAFEAGTAWDDTLLLRGRDGGFRWFLSRALPIRDETGTVLHWFGTHTDIDDQIRARDAQARFGEDLERQVAARTAELSDANANLLAEMAERRRAEEALLQAQKMEAVGQLTGGIAHDFNNLLTGITGSLDLMRRRIEQGRTGEIGRYITAASTSANRAAALTHRLLAFARRQPLDARPVDVNALVASMEDLFHRTLGEAIEVHLSLASDLWTTLCDPHQLENALLNLVINARDAMPAGGTLTIETANRHVEVADLPAEPDRRAGSYVGLSVIDTGVGMGPDVMARVFEPFFTTKPLGQGTGLGLSMIYGFARQSQGYVTLRSGEGEGTGITLLLPRLAGRQAGQAEQDAHPQPMRADGETVLVVEDDAVVRGLVLEILADLGYRTLEARDGTAGLAILQGRATVDLLVTDVGLPGLNGRQLADMARVTRPALKVLFITGYAENAAFGQDGPDKASGMITKPFAVDVLAAKIREVIES